MGAIVGESGTKVRAGFRIDGGMDSLRKYIVDDIYFDPRQQDFRLGRANI